MSRIGSLFGSYAAVPVVKGPRIRLGMAWGAAITLGFLLGEGAIAVLFALTATIAALQTSLRWGEAGASGNQILAGVGAGAVVVAAWIGNVIFGLGVVGLVIASLVFPTGFSFDTTVAVRKRASMAWPTLAAAVPVAIAGGAVVQVDRIDALAFVFLATAVCVYDAGDFLCTGGRRKPWLGPVWGMGGVGVVAVTLAIAQPPPFDSSEAAVVGAILVLACPAGQLFASWLLPRARSHAPALRRLDAWLLAAPVVLFGAWIAQP